MALDARKGIAAVQYAIRPTAPATGKRLLYPRSDGWYDQDSAGVELKLGGEGGVLISRRTTAITSTATAYDFTGLSVTVQAGKVYLIRASGQWRSAATTTGMGLRLGGSATATSVRYNSTVHGGAIANAETNSESALNTAASTSPGVSSTNRDYGWTIDGLIVVNTSGAVAVQFASEIAGSAVTIQPDCYLELQEIA